MTIKMYALGGIDESGRNMTAYEFDDTIIICDMGLHLTNLVLYNNEVDSMKLDEIVAKGIVSDPKLLLAKKDKVKAIMVSHAHLDHVGGVQYLAGLFNCPIYATGYTLEVLKVLMKDSRNKSIPPMKNKLIRLDVNATREIGNGCSIEFVNVTHSVPQAVMAVIHTPNDGSILYAMDYKFDNRPGLGLKPNYERLEQLNNYNGGIKLAIIDSVRSNNRKKTLSEHVVKEMLRDIFIESNILKTEGMIITTFASHIVRLKSIVELSVKLGRRVVFMGRSMGKYCLAAKNAGLIDFKAKGVIICENPREVNKWLSIATKNKKDFLIVCTGHQGEENAVLSRIAEGRTPYELKEKDKVIFSSEVIPTQLNIESSQVLATKLDNTKCKVVRDVHVSGHASREDSRELLGLIKPKHLVPGHGQVELKEGFIELAEELGYKEGETLHILDDQKVYEFN